MVRNVKRCPKANKEVKSKKSIGKGIFIEVARVITEVWCGE